MMEWLIFTVLRKDVSSAPPSSSAMVEECRCLDHGQYHGSAPSHAHSYTDRLYFRCTSSEMTGTPRRVPR